MNSGEVIPVVRGLPCKEDKEWTPGCLYDQLGTSKWLCPYCESHVSKNGGICLNGCGLEPGTRSRMNKLIEQATKKSGG